MINKEKYQDKKLIAFDLYGTCIDHHLKFIRLSWELIDILQTTPITLQDIQERKVEIDWKKIEIDQDLIDLIRRDIERAFLYPETLETLKYIKSKWYKTAVVSNLSKDYAEPLHRLIPKWNFDHEVLSFDVWANKPDPKIYEYLKSISWTDFKDIIMIWDSSKSDVEWSYKVWITPIYLDRDSEWIEEVHENWMDFIQISTLRDLKKIL